MAPVKYIGNADPADGTGAIRLESGEGGLERVLELGGPEINVTEGELAYLKAHGYQLEELEAAEDAPSEAPSKPVSLVSPPNQSSGSTTPASSGS